MAEGDLLEVLFPHFTGISVERVADRGALVRITASSTQASACCPACGYNSSAVHSGYGRSVADTAVGGRRLVIELTVRRFLCRDATCPKKTFAEQVPGLTYWYGRDTLGLRRVHEAIAVALGGRAWLAEPTEPEPPQLPDTPGAGRARAMHAQIHALKNRGVSPYLISRELRIDPTTVHRYLSFASDEDLLGQGRRQRATGLDAHADYLARRYAEGARGGVLQKELEARGVKVSERTVRRFTARFHTEQPAKPAIPKVRDAIALVTTHPDKRTAEDTVLLKELCVSCPDLELLCAQVRRFASILLTRPGSERLAEWIDQARAATLKEAASFATGLLADWNAVAAAVTLKWNSRSTEGQVNRIKMLKRQMFGRAKPDLLRKRVLART